MVKKCIATSLKEALEFLSSGHVTIVSGGTDIMVQKRNVAGELPHHEKDVLYLKNVKELYYVKVLEDGIHIGAETPMSDLIDDTRLPLILRQCLSQIASTNIRNSATLAGNLANASPAGDSIVIDNLLDAKMKLTSLQGSRIVDAKDFVIGVRKTILTSEELIEEIIFPYLDYTHYYYKKVGSRKADSIAKLSFAGAYKLNKNKIEKMRIVFGSVSIKPAQNHSLESTFVGLSIDELKNKIPYFLEEYSKIISPIDDQRSTKKYREVVAMNILREFLEQIKIEGGK